MKSSLTTVCGIFLSIMVATPSVAEAATTRASKSFNWITHGNSCWRACYVAKNNATKKMNAKAARDCPQGYEITQPISCITPGRDPSYLTMVGAWPHCKCDEVCTAQYRCKRGPKPSFFPNVNKEWRKLRRAWRIHYGQAKASAPSMQKIKNPTALAQAVGRNAIKYGVNASQVYEAIEKGEVLKVVPPSLAQIEKEKHDFFSAPITPAPEPLPEEPRLNEMFYVSVKEDFKLALVGINLEVNAVVVIELRGEVIAKSRAGRTGRIVAHLEHEIEPGEVLKVFYNDRQYEVVVE